MKIEVALNDSENCGEASILMIEKALTAGIDLILEENKKSINDHKVYNGDYFIHQRSGARYIFHSDILGTKLELD